MKPPSPSSRPIDRLQARHLKGWDGKENVATADLVMRMRRYRGKLDWHGDLEAMRCGGSSES